MELNNFFFYINDERVCFLQTKQLGTAICFNLTNCLSIYLSNTRMRLAKSFPTNGWKNWSSGYGSETRDGEVASSNLSTGYWMDKVFL